MKMTKKYGRGLYATKNIKKGTIITICEILPLDIFSTKTLQKTDLKSYVFKFDKYRDCIVLGDGEIFNHNDNANVSYKLIQKGPRKVMRFKAITNIKKGQQLFTNYNEDVKVNLNNYKMNLVG